jgi:hypothetical protein
VRNRAVFTIVQNEPVFLPIWLGYYARYFDPSDIYVLDHDSTDGSTDAIATSCNHLRVHRDKSFDHRWLRDTVAAFQAFLLRSYENVLFAEADEFVVADPSVYSGLDDYVVRFRAQAIRCAGFNVAHYPDEEPPLRFDRPILAQRRYWRASRLYCKPLLAKVPLSWAFGFHSDRRIHGLPMDPRLLLLHLRCVDYDYFRARLRSTTARDWSEDDVSAGRGAQNRMADPQQAETWFFRGFDDGERQLIPDRLRTVL